MKHKIINKKLLSSSTLKLDISRENIQFKPGSCVSFKYQDVYRPYSIASSINDDYLRFYIRLFDNGTMSSYLNKLSNGDEIESNEIFSYFAPGQTNSKYVYIATGTGIAPFLSALKSYQHKPEIILYSARTKDDLIEYEYLSQNFNTILTTTRKHENNINYGRLTEYIKYIPIIPNMELSLGITYYLCGINTMIDDVSCYLTDNGIHYKNIIQEQFYQKQD